MQGSNFGWPFCFYDYGQKKFFTNPEYGGDGKTSDRCGSFTPPVAAFPAHWAPVDIMFYSGKQFPKKYQGGAFIAFHGSWNRAPMPQAGYNVTFQPFSGGKPSGEFEVFASGFTGKSPLMNPDRCRGASRWRGASARRIALHRRQPEGQDLARLLHRQVDLRVNSDWLLAIGSWPVGHPSDRVHILELIEKAIKR